MERKLWVQQTFAAVEGPEEIGSRLFDAAVPV